MKKAQVKATTIMIIAILVLITNAMAFNYSVGYKSGVSECTKGETICSGKSILTCIDNNNDKKSPDGIRYDYIWEAFTCNYHCSYNEQLKPICIEKQEIDSWIIFLIIGSIILVLILITIIFSLRGHKK